MTAALPGAEPQVQVATLRLARCGAKNDAWNNGGIAADVDVVTGRVRTAMLKPAYGGGNVAVHPDTHEPIIGAMVPLWPEIRAAVITAARVTPGLKVVGWDVVVGADGPRIIEANFDWDLQLSQAPAGGLLGSPTTATWAAMGADLPDGSRQWRKRWRRRLVPTIRRKLIRALTDRPDPANPDSSRG